MGTWALTAALAMTASVSTAAESDSAAAESDAPASDAPRSEYRFLAGVRHPNELFTANILTGGRLALRGVDAATEPVEGYMTSSAAAIGLRAVVFTFVDAPILSYMLVLPHELGHAGRLREMGAEPEIHLDLPLPYSLEAKHYATHRQTRAVYAGELSVSALGGLQAQEASQRMLTWTTFRSGVLRRGEALAYASTSVTHAFQTVGGRDFENASNLVLPLYRGDPRAYRTAARGALLLDLVDPMLLYSLYASAYRYLVRGERATRAPGIHAAGARFLATSRTLPVPWGVEHQLHVLAAWPWASFDLGVRTGVGARGSFGVELATFDWRVLDVMRAGFDLALWTQPLVPSAATLGAPSIPIRLDVRRDDVRDRTTFGGAARLLFEVDQPLWFLGTRLGWKSVGLWGERELTGGFEVALTGGLKLD